MCEYEEGWHPVSAFFGNTQTNLLTTNSYYGYLSRIMNILKYGNNLTNELSVFMSKQGIQIINEIETKPCECDLLESYIGLRKILINDFDSGNVCAMTNNKVDV